MRLHMLAVQAGRSCGHKSGFRMPPVCATTDMLAVQAHDPVAT